MKYVIYPSMLVESVLMTVVEATEYKNGVIFVSPTTKEPVTEENVTTFDSQKKAELFIMRQAMFEIQNMERSIELRRGLIAKLKENIA